MRARSAIAPWILPALAGAAALAIVGIAGLKLSPLLKWLLVFAALGALAGVLYVRMRTDRAFPPESILATVRALADGPKVDVARLADEGMDGDLLAAFSGLEDTIRSLRQEKSRAEKVLSEIGDGIITVDADGRVALVNRAAEAMLGAESLRERGDRIDAAELHPEIARIAHACIAGGNVLSSEIRLSGVPEKVIGVRAAPFSGAPRGDIALLLLHDISEIRRHEKMQKEFVSNVSHELRTPITAVRATAEALIAGAKNDEELVDRFLNNIVAESDRLSALIDDLMDIAKRESGVTPTRATEMNVAEVVRRAYAPVRPLAERKRIEVGFDLPDDIVVKADEIQIVQLVRNLLDNAVKYTPAEGRVDVSAVREKGEVAISVRDNGIGIPDGEVDRIFERFYRVDKARSRSLGGTGLGLAIVKDIVDGHGGRIEVETELGVGSTFTVRLPGEVEQP